MYFVAFAVSGCSLETLLAAQLGMCLFLVMLHCAYNCIFVHPFEPIYLPVILGIKSTCCQTALVPSPFVASLVLF